MMKKVINYLTKKLELISKFSKISKCFGYDEEFKYLDIGAGNHSASSTKKFFPNCHYYGVDLSKHYNNDETDFLLMEGFWEMDLTQLKFDDIPNDFFDVINMSHVAEHLFNAEEVIKALVPKMRVGGVIYIEVPSFKSTKFPSMEKTLNFFDDDTHVKILSLKDLYNILLSCKLKFISGGSVRNIWRIILIPYTAIRSYIMNGCVIGCVFWDLFGFAEYTIFRK